MPYTWKDLYPAQYNTDNPLSLQINGVQHSMFITSSPEQLCTMNRTPDLTSLLACIRNASKFVYVSVMNYIPIIYTNDNNIMFWSYIDD
ncbi:truncated nick-joining enzyme [Yokapox virus]|uniref:Truncated nick-joining enzyme n=1 Tax=Yokapox virus TaxID=1076255 RepID=G3EI96_9POXV|nr:truncated nick-joining enzyme [Yokapox virus]AEN03607.1 truncated nick-joining enzyme [Yokapox virus]